MAGSAVKILGTDLTGATGVSFDGVDRVHLGVAQGDFYKRTGGAADRKRRNIHRGSITLSLCAILRDGSTTPRGSASFAIMTLRFFAA
jgi:hypothetical protein